jgi:CHAT domain-containing protein
MDSPTRLWWCLTGPFTFLPIHAAGIYNAAGAESVSDYVVSSYTPSLKSLLGDQPPLTDKFKLMVVIQPDIPNGNPLPCTEEELQRISKHVPNDFLLRLGIENVPATVQAALSHLRSSNVVHFACHGIQDVMAPLESGLILHDGHRLTVNEIMKQPTPSASLTFLSACETAVGTENLPDEAMHLAASLQFAGFRSVVATMW